MVIINDKEIQENLSVLIPNLLKINAVESWSSIRNGLLHLKNGESIPVTFAEFEKAEAIYNKTDIAKQRYQEFLDSL